MPPMTENHGSDRRTHQDRDHLPDALEECGRELERLLAGRAPREELRDPVRAFVRAARKAGAPPERALAAFKVMLRSVHAIQSRVLTERGDLASSLAQAVIEAYYEGEQPPAIPTRAP